MPMTNTSLSLSDATGLVSLALYYIGDIILLSHNKHGHGAWFVHAQRYDAVRGTYCT